MMKRANITPWRAVRRVACGCVALSLVTASAEAQADVGTNAAAVFETVLRRAAEAERAGRAAEAVAAYEALLERDTACEAVVAPRLVSLHIGLGQAAQALSWATRVAGSHPLPAGYLAGVYAQLGQFKDAELVLRDALRSESDVGKRVTLLWQLADAQEHAGDADAAVSVLEQARDVAPDGPVRRMASRRLGALQKRLKAADSQREAPLQSGSIGEGTP